MHKMRLVRGQTPYVNAPTQIRPRVIRLVQHVERRRVIARDILMDGFRGMSESSYFVGKSIVLFTLFYCSMNWWHYRSLRKEFDDEDEDKDKDKDGAHKK